MTRVVAHDLWVTPPTSWLVRAAVLDGDAARAAFADWLEARRPGDVAALPAAERRLLPLVAATLGDAHPVLARGAELRRETAIKNRRMLAVAAGVVAALRDAGVDALALKGIPLLVEHYGDLGLRPMSDVDLLVAPSRAARALEVLARAGWREAAPAPAELRRSLCAFDLVGPGGEKLDLHQYLTEHGSTPEAEAGMWRRAHPIRVEGVEMAAPGATDLLVQVCLGALKAGRFPNSRWIPDAMRLIAAGIDWRLFVDEVRRRRVELPVRECLQRLVAEVHAAVPADVRDELWAAPATRARRRRYRVLTRHPRGWGQLLEEYWTLYSFAAEARGERRGPAGFVRFGWSLATFRRRGR